MGTTGRRSLCTPLRKNASTANLFVAFMMCLSVHLLQCLFPSLCLSMPLSHTLPVCHVLQANSLCCACCSCGYFANAIDATNSIMPTRRGNSSKFLPNLIGQTKPASRESRQKMLRKSYFDL